MAKKYLEDDTYFDPLSQRNNVLPFKHAYSHVNAFQFGHAGLHQFANAANRNTSTSPAKHSLSILCDIPGPYLSR
jgi:hypothetical protein